MWFMLLVVWCVTHLIFGSTLDFTPRKNLQCWYFKNPHSHDLLSLELLNVIPHSLVIARTFSGRLQQRLSKKCTPTKITSIIYFRLHGLINVFYAFLIRFIYVDWWIYPDFSSRQDLFRHCVDEDVTFDKILVTPRSDVRLSATDEFSFAFSGVSGLTIDHFVATQQQHPRSLFCFPPGNFK